MSKVIDIAGKRFGRLVALEDVGHKGKSRHHAWRCRCDCGELVVVSGNSLRKGNTKSCGCLAIEMTSRRCSTHGESKIRLYRIWSHLKARCLNPTDAAYNNYGGRGITVCSQWLQYQTFREWALSHGYEDGLSIDRIDNDAGYSPLNCRWTDIKTQCNNRRSNRYIKYRGTELSLSNWCQKIGISYEEGKRCVAEFGNDGFIDCFLSGNETLRKPRPVKGNNPYMNRRKRML